MGSAGELGSQHIAVCAKFSGFKSGESTTVIERRSDVVRRIGSVSRGTEPIGWGVLDLPPRHVEVNVVSSVGVLLLAKPRDQVGCFACLGGYPNYLTMMTRSHGERS
jgi:hypothetical protein